MRFHLRVPLPSSFLLACLLALVLSGCGKGEGGGLEPTAPALAPEPPATPARLAPEPGVSDGVGKGPIRFRDVTRQTGIMFVLDSGNDPQKHFPTSLGSGVAMLDHDGDGRLDLYFPSTRHLPLSAAHESLGNRLYRNLGGFRFEDVTERAGLTHRGFCHGAAVGDVDNDGDVDLYVTGLGGNLLYLNQGDGTYRDVSANSGARCGLWATGAAFLDYDRDGFLDLYVSCYGKWSDGDPHPFRGDEKRGIRVICSPYSITPERHFLFKGRGDGTFEERTAEAGALRGDGRGLGVITADFDGDGWTDIYVANDGCPNFLFRNRGDGTFEDATESSGAATNEAGEVQGSMGVDAQDVDGDGRAELLVTNFRGQYNTLYRNHDGRDFQDVSAEAGIIRDARGFVGWGCALGDLDCDGLPDLFVVNGEVDDNLRLFGQEVDYSQPALIWKNLGGRKFRVSPDPGPFFAAKHPARGAAFGDLDDDGDLDVVVTRMDQRPAVLSNESERGHWLRVVLKASRSNRSAIGATVDVHAGGRRFQRLRRGGDSYLSANDSRLHFGLGAIDQIDRVEVLWPSGRRSRVERPQVDQSLELREPEDPEGGSS